MGDYLVAFLVTSVPATYAIRCFLRYFSWGAPISGPELPREYLDAYHVRYGKSGAPDYLTMQDGTILVYDLGSGIEIYRGPERRGNGLLIPGVESELYRYPKK